MAFFVGLLVHVEEGVDGFGVLAVEVEDHRVDRRLAIAFGGALGIADQKDAIPHLPQVLAQDFLNLVLGLDAQDALLHHGLDLER